jgi:hypothetical protein
VIRTRSSRKIIPVIASLLILHGLFGSAALTRMGLVPTGLGFALTETVLGISLMLGYRWARWLTLGACFLAVAATFVVPILLFLLLGAPKSEAIAFWRNVTSGMAVVFGIVGWFGLAYLRSDEGRRMFSGADAASAALPPEPSWVMIPPAAICLLLLLGTYDSGRRISLFFAYSDPVAPTPQVAMNQPVVKADPPGTDEVRRLEAIEEYALNGGVVPKADEPVRPSEGPVDVVLTDVCITGRKVRVNYAQATSYPIRDLKIGIYLYVDRAAVHLTRDFRLDVPQPGTSAWTPDFDITKAGFVDGDDAYVVATLHGIDGDRLVRKVIVGSDSDPCPDVSTGS